MGNCRAAGEARREDLGSGRVLARTDVLWELMPTAGMCSHLLAPATWHPNRLFLFLPVIAFKTNYGIQPLWQLHYISVMPYPSYDGLKRIRVIVLPLLRVFGEFSDSVPVSRCGWPSICLLRCCDAPR